MFMPLMGFIAISGAIALSDLNADQQSNLLEQPIKSDTIVHSSAIGKTSEKPGVAKDLPKKILPKSITGENTPQKLEPILMGNPTSASEPSAMRQKRTKTAIIKNVLSESKPSPKMFLIGSDARNERGSSWVK